MPKQVSQPSATYPVGTYGPITVNNLPASDAVAFFTYGGNASWGAVKVRILLEMRIGNGPWFSLARDEVSWQGSYVHKFSGATILADTLRVTLPHVGVSGRDLRATFEVIEGPVTTALIAGTA